MVKYTCIWGWTGFDYRQEEDISFFSTVSKSPLGHNKPIQCVLRALSPKVKKPGRETDHKPPSSAEVKNSGVISSIPIRLHDLMLN
jgi:hypothetical protein